MPDHETASMAGLTYIKAPPDTKVWVVVKQYPGGLREQVAAWFSEKLARANAGHIVGRDNALVTLESIEIKDAYVGGK